MEDLSAVTAVKVLWSYMLTGEDAPLRQALHRALCDGVPCSRNGTSTGGHSAAGGAERGAHHGFANVNTMLLDFAATCHFVRVEGVVTRFLEAVPEALADVVAAMAAGSIDLARLRRVIDKEAMLAGNSVETRLHDVITAAVVPSFVHGCWINPALGSSSSSTGKGTPPSPGNRQLPEVESSWVLSDSWEKLSRELASSTNTQPSGFDSRPGRSSASSPGVLPDLRARLDAVTRLKRLPCDTDSLEFWRSAVRQWFVDAAAVAVRELQGCCPVLTFQVFLHVSPSVVADDRTSQSRPCTCEANGRSSPLASAGAVVCSGLVCRPSVTPHWLVLTLLVQRAMLGDTTLAMLQQRLNASVDALAVDMSTYTLASLPLVPFEAAVPTPSRILTVSLDAGCPAVVGTSCGCAKDVVTAAMPSPSESDAVLLALNGGDALASLTLPRSLRWYHRKSEFLHVSFVLDVSVVRKELQPLGLLFARGLLHTAVRLSDGAVLSSQEVEAKLLEWCVTTEVLPVDFDSTNDNFPDITVSATMPVGMAAFALPLLAACIAHPVYDVSLRSSARGLLSCEDACRQKGRLVARSLASQKWAQSPHGNAAAHVRGAFSLHTQNALLSALVSSGDDTVRSADSAPKRWTSAHICYPSCVCVSACAAASQGGQFSGSTCVRACWRQNRRAR